MALTSLGKCLWQETLFTVIKSAFQVCFSSENEFSVEIFPLWTNKGNTNKGDVTSCQKKKFWYFFNVLDFTLSSFFKLF